MKKQEEQGYEISTIISSKSWGDYKLPGGKECIRLDNGKAEEAIELLKDNNIDCELFNDSDDLCKANAIEEALFLTLAQYNIDTPDNPMTCIDVINHRNDLMESIDNNTVTDQTYFVIANDKIRSNMSKYFKKENE